MIKLVSVNIEGDKHLDLVEAFLHKEQPDVVCLQEVFKSDFLKLEEKLEMTGIFKSMGKYGLEPERGDFDIGVGILSHLPFEYTDAVYYSGKEDSVHNVIVRIDEDPQKYYKVLVYGRVKKGEEEFTIGTTHFTWTPNGKVDDTQRRDLTKLLEVLQGIPQIVFCGDFNAPRGREIFDTISQHYTDNIPQEYTTSIDLNLHRAGEELRGKPRMIDGLFSTSQYHVQNVRLQDGVSDHLAIVAEIKRYDRTSL